MTVSPAASAPLARGVGLRDALQASREALIDIQKQLDALLSEVRRGSGPADPSPDADRSAKRASVDRLAVAARRAGLAICSLSKA